MGVKGSNGSQSAHTVFLILALVALSSLFVDGDAYADVSVGRFNLVGNLDLLSEQPNRREEVRSISPILVKGRLPGIGRVEFRFTRQRFHPFLFSKSVRAPILLQGELSSPSAVTPAAASIRRNTLELTIAAQKLRVSRKQRRMFSIRIPVMSQVTKIVSGRIASAAPQARLAGCGSDGESQTPQTGGSTHTRNGTKEVRVITIATDADPEWVARYGTNSNSIIATFLNTAEALFDAQFNIRFRLVAQHLYASNSPYTSTDVGGLLAQFVTNLENATNFGFTRDTYRSGIALNHLFTGKDLDGGVVGMAYIGVACASPALSYGVTQYYGDILTPMILAHELGHNLGAYHDTNDKTGLMYPNISGEGPDHFSVNSIREISNHIRSYPGCFTSEQVVVGESPVIVPDGGIKNLPNEQPELPAAPPEAQYSTIVIDKSRVYQGRTPLVKLSGAVVGVGAVPVPGVRIELLVNGKTVASVKSRSGGRFSFLLRVRIPRAARIAAWVKGSSLGVESNKLTLKRPPGVRVGRGSGTLSSHQSRASILIQ